MERKCRAISFTASLKEGGRREEERHEKMGKRKERRKRRKKGRREENASVVELQTSMHLPFFVQCHCKGRGREEE